MIHFFCGAPRSGSHFQMFILYEALRLREEPFQQLGLEECNCHDVEGLRPILEGADRKEGHFILKGHFGSEAERDFLLGYENIFIYHIWRDLPDALVSQYFFEKRKFDVNHKHFKDYYFRNGQWNAVNYCLFMKNWSVPSAKIHHTRYADLVTDFPKAARAMLDFAGVGAVDLETLRERVSMDK